MVNIKRICSAASPGTRPGPDTLAGGRQLELQVDDVREEYDRLIALGAAEVQPPYDYAGESLSFTLATLADIDGNYFQLVSMGG